MTARAAALPFLAEAKPKPKNLLYTPIKHHQEEKTMNEVFQKIVDTIVDALEDSMRDGIE